MANIIKAGNTVNGYTTTPDQSGALEIRTGLLAGGTPAISIDASQNVALAANATVAGNLTITGTVTGAVGLGVGQTWTNVSSSRAYSTTYTNSTSKPIMVSIFATNLSAAAASCRFYVGGVAIGGFGMSQSGGIDNGGSFVVPAGSTYQVTNTNFSAPTWFELR